MFPVIPLGASTISFPPSSASFTNARLAAHPKTSQAFPLPSGVMGATSSGTDASEMPTVTVPPERPLGV